MARARAFVPWLERATGVPILSKRNRRTHVVQVRWAAWLVLREWGFSTPEIATLFQMNHTTILDGCNRARPEVHTLAAEAKEMFMREWVSADQVRLRLQPVAQ
jgi:hypothetical protein